MSQELREALERVARRYRRARLFGGLAVCWLACAAVGLAAVALAPPVGWLAPLAFGAGSALAAALTVLLVVRASRDRRKVALRVEQTYPDLNAGLLSAVEADEAAASGHRLGYLQMAVIRGAVEHAKSRDWEAVVSSRAIFGLQAAHVLSLALWVVAMGALALRAREPVPEGEDGPASSTFTVSVDPGDAAVEKGGSLLVVARFEGNVPADAALVVAEGPNAGTRSLMSRSTEDPTFAGRVEPINADLDYRVEFQGQSSPPFHVNVFEYPELLRADATLDFPEFAALGRKTVEDVRHVTAVEGTDLGLVLRLNKQVKSARLIDEKGTAIDLEPSAGDDHAYTTSMTLADSHRYRLDLLDADGRASKDPAEIVVNVSRNRPPVLTLTRPSRDVRVSPVEELSLAARVEDDYGVSRVGVSTSFGGAPLVEIELNAPGATMKSVEATRVIDFEALKAEPDQLLTYFVWAEDVGPDGKPRRTSSDMFFAEVRHFEEIFRQGEQPSGGSAQSEGQPSENAQESERLAELQKQIINGTWKVLRREMRAAPTAEYAADVALLAESQRAAIEQTGPLAERLEDPSSKADLEKAVAAMTEAEAKLQEAADGNVVGPLTPALASEQAAYQALLKLRAREFSVVQGGRAQGGGRAGGGAGQRQLNQLELKDDENRFEQQSSARENALTPREQEQREDRQVLNRLRELAQRQADLNDRIKELQAAIEAAESPEAKAEADRQLKRLRDQQQQVLRDTDELRERMEREENRDRMAEAREQVEEGREHVREASEALEEGKLSQALNEGARANRQLDETREQLRKRASDRFGEDLNAMRDQARRLDEQQDKLTEAIEAMNKEARPSLRDSGETGQAREQLGQQGQEVEELLEKMRETVTAAEETEPLLAKGLYDAVRGATNPSVSDALTEAEMLVELGVPEEAVKSSRRAGEGLDKLREGVEKAAEKVLGDETAALRLARDELNDLADQIDRELALAAGNDPNQEGALGRQPGEPRGEGRQPGEPPAEDRQEAQQKGQGQGQQKGQEQGQQKGQGQDQQKGQEQGQQTGQEEGQQKGQGQQKGRGQGQQQEGQWEEPSQGQGEQGQGQQPGQGQGQQAGGGAGRLDRLMEGLTAGDQAGPGGPGGPITGEGFREWSDRMRDVEELLQDPDLRAEAARIRDRARGAREDFRRHSQMPDPEKLQGMVAEPIRELRDRVDDEVRRRESPDSLVPIDRDPVPPEYAEGVRKYYERLGSGR